jgi:hypothetical protein
LVRFNDEEIPLYVTGSENKVFPSIFDYKLDPSFETVLIDRVRSVDREKREVQEPALSGRKKESPPNEFGRNDTRGSEAKGE